MCGKAYWNSLHMDLRQTQRVATFSENLFNIFFYTPRLINVPISLFSYLSFGCTWMWIWHFLSVIYVAKFCPLTKQLNWFLSLKCEQNKWLKILLKMNCYNMQGWFKLFSFLIFKIEIIFMFLLYIFLFSGPGGHDSGEITTSQVTIPKDVSMAPITIICQRSPLLTLQV